MSSTLIVRDATLAINGAPDSRADLGEHMRARLSEVESFDQDTFAQCVEVLCAPTQSEETDHEVLQALTLLGLANPQLAAQLGVSAVAPGRRLAARLERMGEPESSRAVLELLGEHHPGHRAIERDLAALMRRQGMVNDLVDRYLERAQVLLKEGNQPEAIEWLREVLLLDRSRKDVARTIRDLRFQEVESKRGRKRRWRLSLIVLLASVTIFGGVFREMKVREKFAHLPASHPTDLARMKERLTALEGFIQRYPVWHGSLSALAERSDLRVEIEHIEEENAVAREELAAREAQQLEEANLARNRGLIRADSGDMHSALAEFQRAVEIAPLRWEGRERTLRDIEALQSFLNR